MSKTNGVHEYAKTKSELNFELKLNGRNAKIGVSLKKNLFSSWIEALQSVCENLRGTTGPYAAINLNPVGGGGGGSAKVCHFVCSSTSEARDYTISALPS